jgi:hypothetical protein
LDYLEPELCLLEALLAMGWLGLVLADNMGTSNWLFTGVFDEPPAIEGGMDPLAEVFEPPATGVGVGEEKDANSADFVACLFLGVMGGGITTTSLIEFGESSRIWIRRP